MKLIKCWFIIIIANETVRQSVGRSVGWLVGGSVCHYFVKGHEVSLPMVLSEHLLSFYVYADYVIIILNISAEYF